MICKKKESSLDRVPHRTHTHTHLYLKTNLQSVNRLTSHMSMVCGREHECVEETETDPGSRTETRQDGVEDAKGSFVHWKTDKDPLAGCGPIPLVLGAEDASPFSPLRQSLITKLTEHKWLILKLLLIAGLSLDESRLSFPGYTTSL